MIDEFINTNIFLLSLSLTIGYLYITSDNNIILKKFIGYRKCTPR